MNLSSAYLGADYQDAFSQALKTVFASPLTEITMAQLVDGLPEVGIARQTRWNHITGPHPLLDHKRLCDGVMEKTLYLRDTFSADDLYFESHVCFAYHQYGHVKAKLFVQLLQEYSKAKLGSKDFKLRLIEMVAVAVHQIAADLFNFSPKSHTPEFIKYVTEWQKPTGWVEFFGHREWQEPLFAPPETNFLHASYTDSDLYPNGVADMAGYWVEDRIFGGVVVFDRGESGTEVCNRIPLSMLSPAR
jgi:hypothetical protein